MSDMPFITIPETVTAAANVSGAANICASLILTYGRRHDEEV